MNTCLFLCSTVPSFHYLIIFRFPIPRFASPLWAPLVPHRVTNLLVLQETLVWSLGPEDPGEGTGSPLQCSCLENSMTRIPGRLQSIGSQSQTWLWLTLHTMSYRNKLTDTHTQRHPHTQHTPSPIYSSSDAKITKQSKTYISVCFPPFETYSQVLD